MTDRQTVTRRRRTTMIVVIAVVVLLVAAVIVGLLVRGSATAPVSTSSPSAAATRAVPTASAPSGTASSSPKSSAAPSRTSAAPTPQPTKTAAITKPSPVAIEKELTAAVVRMEAVDGTASGPGEISGPSVRFTIRITNTTGRPVDLSNTVVNAYFGASATPAVPIRSPGGKDFPASVKVGSSATGVFVFNIPEASRSKVEVTVDTSVRNPVIAFKGAAPRS